MELSEEEKEKKSNQLVQLFLVWQKRISPLKKKDIMTHVLKDHRGLFNEILMEAAKKLKTTFGFQIKELVVNGGKRCYVLLNLMNEENVDPVNYENETRGVLTFILTTIYMKGGTFPERGLLYLLNDKMKIGKDNEIFGDAKRMLTDFISQQYLKKTKIPTTNPPQFEYSWGVRADLEVSKKQILEHVAETFGIGNIALYHSQYQDMIASDQINQQQQQPITNSQPPQQQRIIRNLNAYHPSSQR